jgi:DHA1 family tetracycline resistance protein-like MFS transporter
VNSPAQRPRSPLVLIFLTVFLDLVGFGIVIPVLPLYAERFGASPLVIGFLLAAYSLAQCIFSPLLGQLSDRIGRRPVLLVSVIGTSLGFLLMGLAQTLWLLFLARIIDGITGGNISTAQAYIADVTPPQERSRGMGLIGAAFGLGFIVGPAIGGLMSPISLAAPLFFAAALAAVNAVAIYFLLPESLPPGQRGRARRHLAITEVFREGHSRQLASVLATYFFSTVAFSLLTATYALFTSRNFGLDATHNGYIFAAQGLLGAHRRGGTRPQPPGRTPEWAGVEGGGRRLPGPSARAHAVRGQRSPDRGTGAGRLAAQLRCRAAHGTVRPQSVLGCRRHDAYRPHLRVAPLAHR